MEERQGHSREYHQEPEGSRSMSGSEDEDEVIEVAGNYDDDDDDEGAIHTLGIVLRVYCCKTCFRHDFTSEKLFNDHVRGDHSRGIRMGDGFDRTEHVGLDEKLEQDMERYENERRWRSILGDSDGRGDDDDDYSDDEEWKDLDGDEYEPPEKYKYKYKTRNLKNKNKAGFRYTKFPEDSSSSIKSKYKRKPLRLAVGRRMKLAPAVSSLAQMRSLKIDPMRHRFATDVTQPYFLGPTTAIATTPRPPINDRIVTSEKKVTKLKKCEGCPKTFLYESHYFTHAVQEHFSPAIEKCDCKYCGEKFPTGEQLQEHLKNALSSESCEYSFEVEFPVQCIHCEKGVFNLPCFKYHMQICNCNKKYKYSNLQCAICKCGLLNMETMFTHVVIRHGTLKVLKEEDKDYKDKNERPKSNVEEDAAVAARYNRQLVKKPPELIDIVDD